MKKIAALTIIASLVLAACGSSLYVIDSETLKFYPEVEDLARDWQGLAEAAQAENCEAVEEYMRIATNFTEEDCSDVFEYFVEGAPEVDWAKTEWTSSMGKAKIFELEGGSIGGFVLNEAEGVWGAEDRFWE